MADDANATAPESDPLPPPAVAPGPPGPAAAAPGPLPSAPADTGYTADGVPTLEGVREKIETRLGTALGATELAEDTPEVRSATERYAARQQAAAEKVEQIRASMHEPG